MHDDDNYNDDEDDDDDDDDDHDDHDDDDDDDNDDDDDDDDDDDYDDDENFNCHTLKTGIVILFNNCNQHTFLMTMRMMIIHIFVW